MSKKESKTLDIARYLNIQTLASEGGLEELSFADLQTRIDITTQLLTLPNEAFSRLQYLQPETGCFNRCRFCSQGAGTDRWQLNHPQLKNLFSCLKTVASIKKDARTGETKGPLIGYERSHRPGTIFPYLDNDVSSYPYLYEFIKYLYEDLGSKVRISSVGYSRHNQHLQNMHQLINKDLSPAFEGIRFSFTPFTFGFTNQAEQTGRFSKSEFLSDFSNALSTYRPIIEHLGIGKASACVELRFNPLAVSFSEDLLQFKINGHHTIKTGPYLLVSQITESAPRLSTVIGVNGSTPLFDNQASIYTMVVSDSINDIDNPYSLEQIYKNANDPKSHRSNVSLYFLQNTEGGYFAINPGVQEDGFFGKQFYLKTDHRPKSGYIDSERYFLNTLIEYKKLCGLDRRQEFTDANWQDCQNVLDLLLEKAYLISSYDKRASEHIKDHIYIMISLYKKALENAEIPPSYFFSKQFTVDTGQIVNQGRALSLFNGLTQTPDLPLTPQEERGYGNNSISTQRGRIWRLSPNPQTTETAAKGKKNIALEIPSLTISCLDTRNLSTITVEGEQLPYHFISGLPLERIRLEDSASKHLLPGVKSMF